MLLPSFLVLSGAIPQMNDHPAGDAQGLCGEDMKAIFFQVPKNFWIMSSAAGSGNAGPFFSGLNLASSSPAAVLSQIGMRRSGVCGILVRDLSHSQLASLG